MNENVEVVNEVESHLAQIRSGKPATSELVFDPMTGSLVLRPRGEAPAPGETVASALAREGFF